MSPSTTTAQPTTATPNTWEKLWRGSGINVVSGVLKRAPATRGQW